MCDSTPANEWEAAVPTPEPAAQADPPAYDFGLAEEHLLSLQQELRAQKIPVVILLEGWAAAGKGTMAGELLEGLDPRGYHVCIPQEPDDEASSYPEFRRFWINMPEQGKLTLFIGGWYERPCADCVESKRGRHAFGARLERINQMEHMLQCDGVLLLKFFLQIPHREQKRRLTKLASKKLTRDRVSKADWAQNKHYDEWQAVYNQAMAATSESGAMWHLLRAENKRECKQQLYSTVTAAFEQALEERKAGLRLWDTPALPDCEPTPVEPIAPLSTCMPFQAVQGDYKQALHDAQKKLNALQYELFCRRIPMVLAFEGWDAAGKGGSIRRLSAALDVRGFTVIPIASPTPEEKAHHHLWRFWKMLPQKGHIAIFDRTWYGRVMVERIEGFCTQAQWQRAYEEMNLFERELVQSGAIVRKFWLQIDSDEQLKRFVARRDDPQKQWKITDEDWRNREKWLAYETAVNEMLQKTHTAHAPWIVVEANNKQYARLKVLHSVIAAIEERLIQDKKQKEEKSHA
ncbi:MAG: polyphosphate:AMP phosphotransferase [Clostridia bacterium]